MEPTGIAERQRSEATSARRSCSSAVICCAVAPPRLIPPCATLDVDVFVSGHSYEAMREVAVAISR